MRGELGGQGTDTVRTPRISIVVPVYNAERYLDDTIRSVLAQSFREWELLLVDDGSTDGSTAIARRCAAADPARVRCLEHPGHANRGQFASRVLGRATRGPTFWRCSMRTISGTRTTSRTI